MYKIANPSEGAAPMASTNPYISSWGSLLNPLSSLMGGVDRIPETVSRMFPGSPATAHKVAKAGSIILAAGLISGALRTAQHVTEELTDSNDPAKSVDRQLGTTFQDTLNPVKPRQRKKAAVNASEYRTVPRPDPVSLGTLTNTVLPAGAMLLGALGAWKLTDTAFDKYDNSRLTGSIDRRTKELKSLIKLRAQLAHGTADEDEVKRTIRRGQCKQATATDEVLRTGTAITGATLLALAAIVGVSAYNYHKGTNVNNLRYKAMRKGLDEYAQSRSLHTPITQVPVDAYEYFKDIDNPDKSATPRGQAEIGESNSPIKVTL